MEPGNNNTFYCLILFLFVLITSFDQKDDLYIDYEFPNEINIELLNHINAQIKKDSTTNFFAITTNIKDTVYLNLIEFDDKLDSKLNNLINQTDRRIILKNNYVVPILFKTDLLYSTIINKPNENDEIEHILFGGGGFYLHFYSVHNKGIILQKGFSY